MPTTVSIEFLDYEPKTSRFSIVSNSFTFFIEEFSNCPANFEFNYSKVFSFTCLEIFQETQTCQRMKPPIEVTPKVIPFLEEHRVDIFIDSAFMAMIDSLVSVSKIFTFSFPELVENVDYNVSLQWA